MLPSLRLIVVGFVCGFVLVFAGLRVVASLHVVHAGLPIMSAHAATLPPASRYDVPPAPVLYDMRFVSAVPPSPAAAPSAASVVDRTFATAAIVVNPLGQEPARTDLVDAPPVSATATEPEPLVMALAPASPIPAEPAPVAPVIASPPEPIISAPVIAATPEPARPESATEPTPTAQAAQAPQAASELAQPAAATESPARIAALPHDSASQEAVVAAAEVTIGETFTQDADAPDLDGAPRVAAAVTAPVEETKTPVVTPAPAVAAKTARKKRQRIVRRAPVARIATQQQQQQPPRYYRSLTGYTNPW